MSDNKRIAAAFGTSRFDRRLFLKSTAGLAALGAVGGFLTPKAGAQTGLVALVHTQAAGDAGPVDSMISKLKLLAEERGLQTREVYAQDPATYETIFRTLGMPAQQW